VGLDSSRFFQQLIFLPIFPTTSEACPETLAGKALAGVSIKEWFDVKETTI